MINSLIVTTLHQIVYSMSALDITISAQYYLFLDYYLVCKMLLNLSIDTPSPSVRKFTNGYPVKVH